VVVWEAKGTEKTQNQIKGGGVSNSQQTNAQNQIKDGSQSQTNRRSANKQAKLGTRTINSPFPAATIITSTATNRSLCHTGQVKEARRLLMSNLDKRLATPDSKTAKRIKRQIRLAKKKDWLSGKKHQKVRAERASEAYFRLLRRSSSNILLTKSEIKESIFVRDLKAKYFRWINEKLYKISGRQGLRLFKGDDARNSSPAIFEAYLAGYSAQVSTWPLNPTDAAIEFFKRFPPHWKIADFGCGDCRFSKEVPQNVRNVDLYSSAGANGNNVTICSMAQTPFTTESFDAVVMCLSLMGTDYPLFLREAWRVLRRDNGILWIAEVRSRFESSDGKNLILKAFKKAMNHIGFQLTVEERPSKMFFVMVFRKSLSKNFEDENSEVLGDDDSKWKKPKRIKRSSWPRLKICEFRKRQPKNFIIARQIAERGRGTASKATVASSRKKHFK